MRIEQTKSKVSRTKEMIKIRAENCIYKLQNWTQEEIENQKRPEVI